MAVSLTSLTGHAATVLVTGADRGRGLEFVRQGVRNYNGTVAPW